MKKNILIMGNYGKEFHLYSLYYKNAKKTNISLFTSNKISSPKMLLYPSSFSGLSYPNGIPILPEEELEKYIVEYHIHEVVFAGSDITFEELSKKEKQVRSYNVDFKFSEVERIMPKPYQKTIAVCNVFPHQNSNSIIMKIAQLFSAQKKTLTWGNLPSTYEDLLHEKTIVCTKETPHNLSHNEMYTLFLSMNHQVAISNSWSNIISTEKENILLYYRDGNDIPLVKPDIYIVVVDTTISEDIAFFYPGRINVELANIIILHGSCTPDRLLSIKEKISLLNENANLITEADLEEFDTLRTMLI